MLSLTQQALAYCKRTMLSHGAYLLEEEQQHCEGEAVHVAEGLEVRHGKEEGCAPHSQRSVCLSLL